MLKFGQFIRKTGLKPDFLEERLLTFNNDARFGQVVFLAGGAGSGKGFAQSNFMNNKLFKVRDVDAWKIAFLKLNKLKNKYPELTGLNLRTATDVSKLHHFIKEKGIKEKTLDLLLGDSNADRLPNILFDVTLKDMAELNDFVPKLIDVGYKPKDIHITWILTNYPIAVKNNANRARVVPDDILLATHEGAAKTMLHILNGGLPKNIDGDINVILNNPELTVVWTDPKTGKPLRNTQGKTIIKDFSKLRIKKSGGKIKRKLVKKQLAKWVMDNAPKTAFVEKVIK